MTAESIDLKSVPDRQKVISLGELDLQTLNSLIKNLIKSTTFCADKVVMMFLNIHIFILALLAADLYFFRNAALRHQLEVSVYRCKADIRIRLLDTFVKAFRGNVTLTLKKGLQDPLPLCRMTQTLLLDKIRKNLPRFLLSQLNHPN